MLAIYAMGDGELPIRCFLSLDVHNMLNRMSQDHNKVYFRHANGKLDLIHQQRGYAQGCPLSACFASFVFGELLFDINKDLVKRVHKRRSRKDPGEAENVAFFDDANAPLLYEDSYWYLRQIIAKGPKYGITINAKKTKILT
eukprot:4106572-Ditylum_brightwellii.AAC.3